MCIYTIFAVNESSQFCPVFPQIAHFESFCDKHNYVTSLKGTYLCTQIRLYLSAGSNGPFKRAQRPINKVSHFHLDRINIPLSYILLHSESVRKIRNKSTVVGLFSLN